MKRLHLFLAACILALAACATTGTPEAQFIDAATKATVLVDQVTLAADAAVKANVLKGQDAANTLAAVKLARDGLNAAKATADPAQGLTKVNVTLALLTATQTYLATLGAKP